MIQKDVQQILMLILYDKYLNLKENNKELVNKKNMDVVKKIKNYTYKEKHCLGQGSFGKVYEGRQNQGLKVAIKRVQQSMVSKDPYLRASLQTQINIMKKLNHPNIVKLYDVVITNNSIYLIMEYCAGGDLKRYCRNRKLGQEEATTIIKHVCQAFQQIVQLGIIHRDLKPANILVHEGVFKICDFGFAKFFTDAARMARTCVGTPIYMSPQVLSQKNYTQKTDVWSLGILYYQLLFGKLPYYGSTQDALFKNITRGQLMIPSCSSFASNFLRGALEIEQGKRFSWNKIFELFNLDPLQQHKFEGIQSPFYKIGDIKKQSPNKARQQFEALNINAYKQQHQNYEAVDEELNKKIAPQRRPINPLAFQNQLPPVQMQSVHQQVQNQNIPPLLLQQKKNLSPNAGIQPKGVQLVKNRSNSQQASLQNPRFLYFVLIQLIVNPIKNSYSFPQLISAIYRRALDLYTKKIEKQKEINPLYTKVLSNQFDELKSIEAQIPNFLNANMEKSAEAVYRESAQNGSKSSSLTWIKKIMVKNYTYV